jgi:hypothetical protein
MAAQATDHLTEYVRFLGRIGLSPGEIRSGHGVDDENDRALSRAIREGVGEDPAALYRRAHRLLAHSSRGIDARQQFWNHAPATQIDEVFGAYGCRFEVRDPETGRTTDCGTHHGPVELVLREPASGQVRRTTFSFPDTPLGDDNYPALIAAVNEQLLAETDLRFVLLTNEIDHWRFVLIEHRDLSRLRERRGDRLAFHGHPLLRETQPAAYARDIDALSADELARLPAELVPEPQSALDGSESLADRAGATFERVADDVERTPEASFEHGDDAGPSVDRLANAADPGAVVTDGGAGATTAPTGEATDERVAALFDDLDDVSLSREAVERFRTDRSPTGSVDIDPDDYDPTTTDDAPPEGDLDEVFDHVEAVAAETPVEPVAGEDGVTSSDVLEAIEHENAGSDPDVEDGFVWVDPEQLTPTPEAVYEAMLRG